MNLEPSPYKPIIRNLIRSLLCLNIFIFVVLSSAHAETVAKPANDSRPVSSYVAIIIDDLGYKLHHDQRALNLPGQVTFAFLPYTPQVSTLAERAHSRGNEVMLHLPMQSLEPMPIGPGALTKDMGREEFKISVLKSILSVPHVSGVNNHMGSLITSQKTQMNWLMEELARTSLFFIDSRTTASSLAQKAAAQHNVANTQRNIFLDHQRDRQSVEQQFDKLISMARKNGTAVAIGHPYPVTMDVLEEKIPQLKAAGIRLIPASELIQKQVLFSQSNKNQAIEPTHALTQIHHHHHH